MANKVARMRDSGVPLIVEVTEDGVPKNISAATSLTIVLRRPSGRARKLGASFTTDGTDGKLQYVTDTTTLDCAGVWQVSAHIVTPSFNIRTASDALTVENALE